MGRGDCAAAFNPRQAFRPRWQQFVNDCSAFVRAKEKWAGLAKVGIHRLYSPATAIIPLMYPGRAGLFWAIKGRKLVELHRDWALIEIAANGSRRVFHPRPVDAVKVTLPVENEHEIG